MGPLSEAEFGALLVTLAPHSSDRPDAVADMLPVSGDSTCTGVSVHRIWPANYYLHVIRCDGPTFFADVFYYDLEVHFVRDREAVCGHLSSVLEHLLRQRGVGELGENVDVVWWTQGSRFLRRGILGCSGPRGPQRRGDRPSSESEARDARAR